MKAQREIPDLQVTKKLRSQHLAHFHLECDACLRTFRSPDDREAHIVNCFLTCVSCDLPVHRKANHFIFPKDCKGADVSSLIQVISRDSVRCLSTACTDKEDTSPKKMERHIYRQHMRLRPYRCQTCDKRFKDAVTLRYHEEQSAVHSRSYYCPQIHPSYGACLSTFVTRKSWERHNYKGMHYNNVTGLNARATWISDPPPLGEIVSDFEDDEAGDDIGDDSDEDDLDPSSLFIPMGRNHLQSNARQYEEWDDEDLDMNRAGPSNWADQYNDTSRAGPSNWANMDDDIYRAGPSTAPAPAPRVSHAAHYNPFYDDSEDENGADDHFEENNYPADEPSGITASLCGICNNEEAYSQVHDVVDISELPICIRHTSSYICASCHERRLGRRRYSRVLCPLC